ncbi:hypothetical protein [Nevskia sp.]|uniref:hypothetical protein n=1 Tax=Nevskia sp. TaxID=1929292 RepID=UPI003F6F3D2E
MNTVTPARPHADDSERLASRRLSLEVFLLFGLPVMSIAACAVLAFIAYAQGYTEIASHPAAGGGVVSEATHHP